jgi:membrane-bound lytic murein transglycosylase D
MADMGEKMGPSLKVTAELSSGQWATFRFYGSFKIGRLPDCDLAIDNPIVSRTHAHGVLEGGRWFLRDLGSANGLFYRGERIPSIAVDGQISVRLGEQGPEIRLEVEKPAPDPPQPGKGTKLAHHDIVRHYFSKESTEEPAGEHTVLIRQAFAQVEAKKNRRFGLVIFALIFIGLGAGVFAYQQHRELKQQRATAEEIFYAIKSQDIDLANLDRAIGSTGNQAAADELNRFRSKRKELEQNYDQYLASLHIYNPKLTERQRLVLRVARIFGECELDMPPDFEAEINRYIAMWQASGRLKAAVMAANQNGYTETISREMLARGLPPQFFYLALQESNFNPYAVGPLTRKGFAKGMWQFIPETAVKYSLHLGPLVDQPRPDPSDERQNFQKATKAATLYIQDLYGTDAQASGFLVMACYNWGEDQVLPLIRSMPANPKDRNFWKLLTKHRDMIPQQTYDYVFYIASAAVIGENPRQFGFDFDNPLANAGQER